MYGEMLKRCINPYLCFKNFFPHAYIYHVIVLPLILVSFVYNGAQHFLNFVVFGVISMKNSVFYYVFNINRFLHDQVGRHVISSSLQSL